jgi:hypothetical protein
MGRNEGEGWAEDTSQYQQQDQQHAQQLGP